jgi:hypothetical protein
MSMSEKDIVERLRSGLSAICENCYEDHFLLQEAAETIENCRDEIERLRKREALLMQQLNYHELGEARLREKVATLNVLLGEELVRNL